MFLYIFFSHLVPLSSIFNAEGTTEIKPKMMIFTKSGKVAEKGIEISELSVTKLLDNCTSYQHKGKVISLCTVLCGD